MALPASAPITLSAIQTEYSVGSLTAASTPAGLDPLPTAMLDFLGKSSATLYEFQTAGTFGPYTISKSSMQGIIIGAGGRGGGYRVQTFNGEFCYGGGGGSGGIVAGTITGSAGGSYTVVVGAASATGAISENLVQSGSSSVSGSWGATYTAAGGWNGGRGNLNISSVGGNGGKNGPGTFFGGAGGSFGGGGAGYGSDGASGIDMLGEGGAGLITYTVGSKTYTYLAEGGFGGGQAHPGVNGTSYYGHGGVSVYGSGGSATIGGAGNVGMVAFYF